MTIALTLALLSVALSAIGLATWLLDQRAALKRDVAMWKAEAACEHALNAALLRELESRQDLVLACRDEVRRLRNRELRAAVFGQTFSRNVRGGVS
jgi:hypothetical protein